MPPVERNHPIETLASCGSDDALTMCVRLRRAHRRLDHLERHRPKGFVNGGREDAVTIVDEHAIHAIERQAVAELLWSSLPWDARRDSSARFGVCRCRG